MPRLHKEGKKWIIGPKSIQVSSGQSRFQPFILRAVGHTRSWSGLSKYSRTSRFCFEFSSEAQRYGVCFQPSYTYPEHARKMHICRNLNETISYVHSQGKRCLGALIASDECTDTNINEWIKKLITSGIKNGVV